MNTSDRRDEVSFVPVRVPGHVNYHDLDAERPSIPRIVLRSPYAGAGLITIERERVFLHQWFRTSTTSSVQRVTLPPGFEGNGYVAVEFLRDPASDEIFMSPLS
jgi:hypothetical protein